MKLQTIFTLIGLVAAGGLNGCSRPPEKITWDFTHGQDASVIGWYPKSHLEVSYRKDGDIDFTLVEGERRFHERVFSISAMRDSRNDKINHVHAHFGNNLTAEQAVPEIKRILTAWGGAMPTGVSYSVDDWFADVKAGKITTERHGFRGRDGGQIDIILSYNYKQREKNKVVMTFMP